MKKEIWVPKRKRCWEFNGKDKLSWLNSKRNRPSRRKWMFIEPFIKKTKRLKEIKRNNSERRKKLIELWLNVLYSKKDSLQSIKSSWKKKKESKPKRPWQESKAKIKNLLLIKRNLIVSLKMRESKSKKNNKKTGRKDRKPESIFFIKFSMIEREKLDNISPKNKKNYAFESKIELKWRGELASMNCNNKKEKEISSNVTELSSRKF